MQLVNKQGAALDAIFAFDFSPDSAYFAYTFYTDNWTLGIIDLQSGKKVEFTSQAVTIPPEIDSAAPFDKMLPTVAGWSADSKQIYFDMFLMVGCRGPHALYAAQWADLINGNQNSHQLGWYRRKWWMCSVMHSRQIVPIWPLPMVVITEVHQPC